MPPRCFTVSAFSIIEGGNELPPIVTSIAAGKLSEAKTLQKSTYKLLCRQSRYKLRYLFSN